MASGTIGTKRKFKTSLPSELKEFEWEIADFPAVAAVDKELKGIRLDFDAGDTIGLPTKWRFSLKISETGAVGIYLELLNSLQKHESIFAEFDYAHRNEELNEEDRCKNIRPFTQKLKRAGFKFVFESIEDILSERNYNLEENGSLIIRLKFTLFNEAQVTSHAVDDKLAKLDETSGSGVLEDLGKLLDSEENFDVIIQTADGKELKAHKAILAARSSVFLTMFNTEMKESASGVVFIEDLSHEAMYIVLKFIYTGKLGDKWEEVGDEVIHAAEKYGLPFMKEYCGRKLASTCTPSNAWSLKTFAKLHCLSQAEKEIDEYIKTNIGTILEAQNSA